MDEKEQLRRLKGFVNEFICLGGWRYPWVFKLLRKHELIKSHEENNEKAAWLKNE